MNTIDKFFITLLIIGVIGVFVNMIRAAEPGDWRNHTYSTVPVVAAAVYWIAIFLIDIWK